MKYAILLDGGFLIAKLKSRHHFPSAREIMSRVDAIKADPALAGHEHLRTYFYHSEPATDKLVNPISGETLDLQQTTVHQQNTSLIQALETMPDMAVRLGELAAIGWAVGGSAFQKIVENPRPLEERDLVPNITQKGVDLRIALDIARLSLRGLVDTLVVTTGDSDFVPAFKFARREGLRIYLDAMGHGVKRELKVHVDKNLLIPVQRPNPKRRKAKKP